MERLEIVAAGEVSVVRVDGPPDLADAVHIADSLGPDGCAAVFVGPSGSPALEEFLAELTARSRRR